MQKDSSSIESLPVKIKASKGSLLGFLFLCVGFVLLDQSTKLWSEKYFMVSTSATDIRNYYPSSQHVFTLGNSVNWLDFNTTYVRNTGAAWGFLGNLPENIRPYFFYILTIVAMIVILIFFFKTKADQIFSRLGIAFIFAGAAGNFIDRIWLHYVIDWIHVQWSVIGWQYDYPVFNVADCCVTTGVIILLIDAVREELLARKLKKKKEG
ncbi:signal peptidase II [Fluviispira multicolorata]|uniref:Lipoprotein signal peptidase n=1 Tax=Fluviispira multicolorata TaxID=2654512 RepID=A0A833JHE1_9BACT|nr:signal peptidase II [Fluviispira multicolorata]KAB8033347.1 signal peptidase II [Fluviispira multicolorata]